MKAAAIWIVLGLIGLAAPVGAAGGTAKAMLSGAQGTVELKPAGKDTWARANLMTLLSPGDALRTAKDGCATVTFFGDGHREKMLADTTAAVKATALQPLAGAKRVRAGRASQAAPGVIAYPATPRAASVARTFAGRPGAVGLRAVNRDLVLLSPLGPKTRNPRPAFRWTPVDGAVTYRVSVEADPAVQPLSFEVAGTECDYPADRQPLRDGGMVVWSVDALQGEKVLARSQGRFRLLAAKDRSRLMSAEAPLKRMAEADQLDATGPLLLSRLYLEHGLVDEAIVQLKRAAAICPDDPAICEELSRLYDEAGLAAAAREQLQRANELRGAFDTP